MTEAIARAATPVSPRFNPLFPRVIDNTYRGHKLALWLFGALLFMKTGMSLGVIFNGHSAATRADGIPLRTFPPAAAQTVLALFAIWGVAQFILCLLGVLALLRYRAMVPLMFALFLLEHLGRKLVLVFIPIVRTGAPPGFYINLVLLAMMIFGLLLSLWGNKRLAADN